MTRCPRCQRRLPPRGECETHGRPTSVESVDDALPQVVAPPGFALGRHVAIGGSSIVYSVSGQSGAPAILKFGRWRDRDIHERFEREATILRTLGAPLTPSYLAHGSLDGWPYLLMEEVPGETLAAWMSRSGGRGALGEIVSILLRVAHAVHAVHERGYIHRDLKPENLVITSQHTRILDFGLAAREADGLTQTGIAAGTVHYIAPEQLRTGATIDRRADIYSLGVIAYEMITGEPPFTGERRAIEYQHQVARPAPLRDIRDVPLELEDPVLGCLAKQPEGRPQTMQPLIEGLTHASSYIQTLKGIGQSSGMKKVIGSRDSVVLAWIEGGDPIAVTRAINDVHGIVVRSRAGAMLAAFAAQFHDAPVAVALAACRAFAHERCRVVIHVTNALVRRSAQGKPAFYGPDIEKPTSWLPTTPFTGVVISAAAARLATTPTAPAADVPGFFRDLKRDRTDATDARREPQLVGRDRVVQDVVAIANAGGMLIGLFGEEGAGKSRMIGALAERLQKLTRDVIAIRGRRRLLGDRPDDERLTEALGGEDSLEQALYAAGERRAVVLVDDVGHFSAAAQQQLLRKDLAVSRIVTSRVPLFEVHDGEPRRLVIELQPLSFTDAERLLRDLLEPARLIPEVLLQRLAIRGAGNPGLLVALARDIKHRGGIRRQEGNDDWYVAADEIDTLLAAPGAAWLAARGLEGLAPELAPIVRMASALGPKFNADEVASLMEMSPTEVVDRLRWLVQDGVFAERNDWYEFVDASLQDAIYDYALDERSLVHGRALRYWLAHRSQNLVGWLARVAHHAAGSGDAATTAACSTILAREARRRGEASLAAELEQRALAALVDAAPTAIASTISALDES